MERNGERLAVAGICQHFSLSKSFVFVRQTSPKNKSTWKRIFFFFALTTTSFCAYLRLRRILAWALTSFFCRPFACCPLPRENWRIYYSCIVSLSNIFQELLRLIEHILHVKGCPETYTRIRCHVLLGRLLVNVSKMQQRRQKHPQMCDITFAEITLFVFLLLILSLVSWVIWGSHILDDAVSNLSCANEWHSDSFEGLC